VVFGWGRGDGEGGGGGIMGCFGVEAEDEVPDVRCLELGEYMLFGRGDLVFRERLGMCNQRYDICQVREPS